MKSRSVLRRDSKDRIKIFNRDEWLLKRQRERTEKLLDIGQEFQKSKEKIGVDETSNSTENKCNSSNANSSLCLSRKLSRDTENNAKGKHHSSGNTSRKFEPNTFSSTSINDPSEPIKVKI